MRILLIEDEKKVANFIKCGLEDERHKVDVASDGLEGEKKIRQGSYDLVILDILLPEKDGFTLLEGMRKDGNLTPVLALTARGTTEDIVHGLGIGADDYLVKPFAFDELLARITSLERRSKKTSTMLKVADLELDTIQHHAIRNGATIMLTRREYFLLEYFMRHPHKLITRSQIEKEVWGYDYDPGTNIVDVYINHLRKKIDNSSELKLLHSMRGKGYILTDRPVHSRKS